MTTTLHWNNVLLEVSRRDYSQGHANGAQPGPTRTSRAMALVHLAIYNAVAAKLQPTALYTKGLPDASGKPTTIAVPTPPADAGLPQLIDGAAATMLGKLYPRQTAYVGLSTATGSADKGFIAGAAIAIAIFESRMGDGSDAPNPASRATDDAAYAKHRTDPFEPGQPALGASWGRVAKFCGTPVSISRYPGDGRVNLLDDESYRRDYDEVKRLGSRHSAERTAEQALIGVYWGYDGANGLGVPPRMYNQIARTIIKDKGLSDEFQIAQLLAKVNCAMADAGIDAWREKYSNDLWRPVVGIRNESHEVAGVGPDVFWSPLGAPQTNRPGVGPRTPPFPAYPSGHATFGAALFQVLAMHGGAQPITTEQVLSAERGTAVTTQAFKFVSDELDGAVIDADGSVRTHHERAFGNYAYAIQENALSRVYLGVHWRFDGLANLGDTDVNVGGVPLGLAIGKQANEFFDALAAGSTTKA